MERVLNGRYRLVESLGAGGMGEVWRAVDDRLDRTVAVKLVRPDKVDSDEAVARFQREARLTAQLAGHANVVILHDFGEYENSVYAVMELVRGRTLSAILRDTGPQPVPRAADWAAQVTSGLAAAHAAGIVHRDVKPANLMALDDGTVKILDFGIAGFHEAVTQSRRLTQTGAIIGTPLYMSPEQARCENVGAASDLYSLGAILYQLLTGHAPFRHDEPLGVLRMHLMERPRPPREARPDLPAELDSLVLALLEKDPADRPAGAHEVRERLLPFTAASAPVEERPSGTAGPQAAGVRPPRAATGPPGAEPRDLHGRLREIESLAEEGHFAAAAQRTRACLPDLERAYGPTDPETIRARRRLAYLTGKSGEPARAVEIYRELLPQLDRVYGRHHPETLAARYYLASNAGRARDHATAARVHAELLPDLTAAHGPDAHRVLTTRLYLAFEVGETGEHGRAIALLDRLLPDLRRVLGTDHETTLRARHYRAAYTGHAGAAAEAARLYHELLAEHTRVNGAGHPDTARIRARLRHWEDRAR
ncbi:serine/threonine-protein kinase [Halostreptopolyspora alba]|uniref:serine/threonine-protein kinase n=1 Tax=Halostreptopolyspora alba TaxID=2487137 RepID=UPI0026B9B8EF